MAEAHEISPLARRIGAGANPEVKLVSSESRTSGDHRVFDGLAGQFIDNSPSLDYSHPFIVLGGPGTGKTSFLVDAALAHIRAGGSADDIMFVTPSKESATRIRNELFHALVTGEGYAGTGALVRSVHSWAFAYYRAYMVEQGEVAPRLISGAEHDIVIRELLREHARTQTGPWPEDVREAVGYVGFARQLRDVLLRATERGVGPQQLQALGMNYNRPMWTAAAEFLQEYQGVANLAGSVDVNASELLHKANEVMEAAAGTESMQRRINSVKLLLVDDAHNLDPAAARFVEYFMPGAQRVAIAGDPDQCVFHFRGADEAFLTRYAKQADSAGGARIILSRSHRVTEQACLAINHLQTRLPFQPARMPIRGRDSVDGTADASLSCVIAPTETSHNLSVADALRWAHTRGIEYRDMAIIVRSDGNIPALRRVLMNHGVPVQVDSTSIVLAEQPLVELLLLAVQATYQPLTTAEMKQLLESIVGGADAVMVRRVERAVAKGVRRARLDDNEEARQQHPNGRPFQAADYLTWYLNFEDNAPEWVVEYFQTRENEVLHRVMRVLQAGREAKRNDAGPEMILWRIWQATELSNALQNRALRGGTVGAQADQDLDAVMNLFDLVGDFVERNPRASVKTFVEDVRAQELPTGGRDRRGVQPNAVEILPAHAAAGREWEFVVVAGVQEETWPTTTPTVGGLFSQLDLVDLLDNNVGAAGELPSLVEITASRVAATIAEERRLFLLAISRSRGATVVTTVNSVGEEGLEPSRFISEIRGVGASEKQASQPEVTVIEAAELPRVLAVEPMVAELRDAVTDSERPHHERVVAARNLARLAEHGVFGAHPDEWWGMAEVSTDRVINPEQIRLSPSQLERMDECVLRAFLDRNRGEQERTEAMRVGEMVHAIAEGFVHGLSLEDALRIVNVVIPEVSTIAGWRTEALVKQWNEGIQRLHAWVRGQLDGLDPQRGEGAVAEQILRTTIGSTAEGIEVVLSGRADLLITQARTLDSEAGALGTWVIDFKSSKNALKHDEAKESPQLRAYQYLLQAQSHDPAAGSDRAKWSPLGAKLVYPGVKHSTMAIREQLSAEDNGEIMEQFRNRALQIAERSNGPRLKPTPGSHCDKCNYQFLCPAFNSTERVI
ncbi:ATP-dependent DNA helicase [uncultured Corynebacterium sp.]|uniref:ATP-dependent DNA helicase n=1 Tax=uncultured Corynebacterium sp. TaxID=159447 RepID=UPI0025DFBC01|nr:ATP-dependent DNA helicase [uncultured Corynebacterium sp.]